MECLGAPYFFGGFMNTCDKCGHNCHCKDDDCKECINDVCYKCECKNSKNRESIPPSMLNGL